ncbi:MAG: hypothetical protein V9H26_08845 [Verrucomicrobiota bacterium]|nr:hypothetical protein [Limisphaerales bacterium]
MSSESPTTEAAPQRRWLNRWLFASIVTAVACGVYIRTHPLVFNESFFSHAHCMPQALGALNQYAVEHFGKFPTHTNGYGDALLLLVPEYTPWSILTGPGYDAAADKQWKQIAANVPESECGRDYVQGLTTSKNPEIAMLFDKIPTPGGDHCHLLTRLWTPLKREVGFVRGDFRAVRESKWPEFAKNQIELLVKDGFDRAAAEALYAEKGKVP